MLLFTDDIEKVVDSRMNPIMVIKRKYMSVENFCAHIEVHDMVTQL